MTIAFVSSFRGKWRGYSLIFRDFDAVLSSMMWLSFKFWWGSINEPKIQIEIKRNFGQGSFQIGRYKCGKYVGWRFRGPIERVKE